MAASPILQVVTDTDRRGAQVFAKDLHDAFVDLGLSVRTVALTSGASGGLDATVLGPRRLAPETLRQLRHEVRASRCVVAHGSSTLPACALATLGTGVPFVYRQISDSLFWASTPLRRARVRFGLRRAARVVALWRGSADTLAQRFGVTEAKLRIVPNGVPTRRFPPLGDQDRRDARAAFAIDTAPMVLAYIGALVAEKGVDLAIRAASEIPDSVLLVAGDGPERERLVAMSQSLAPGRVVFTGSLAEPRAAYAAADVIVLPSRGGDSMPATLIEAGMLGLPSVSTPVNGIPDIVVDGATGALVPVGDASAFTRAVRSLLEDPERARSLGRAARARCEARFGIDVVAAQWLAVLEELAPGISPPRT